jgi:hypothetical protein
MREEYIKKAFIGLNFLLGIVAVLLISSFVDSSVFDKGSPADLSSEDARRSFEEVIQINVLNGCGEKGLAGKVQKGLRRMGFDVVEVGNFSQEIGETIIIDRLGDKKSAYKLAHSLGIEERFIFTDIDSTMYIRASLVLGNNYKDYPNIPTQMPHSIAESK